VFIKNPKLKNIILIFLAGILLGISFPPINLFFCSFFGLALIIYLALDSKSYGQLFLRSYAVFAIEQLITISWLGLSGLRANADFFLVIGGLVTIIIHSLFLLIPVLVFYFISKNIKIKKFPDLTLSFFPFIWTAFEYFHSLGEVSFPWLTIGNAFTTQLDKIQFIEITGVYGISFWVCTIAVLIYYIYKESRKDCSGGCLLSFRKRKNIYLYIVILVLYILPNIYTAITGARNEYTDYVKEGTVNVGIIQPNFNPWTKWHMNPTSQTQEYADLLHQMNTRDTGLDLIVLPEAALTYYLTEPHNLSKFRILKDAVDSLNVPVLIGAPDILIYTDTLTAPPDASVYNGKYKYSSFNTAFLLKKGQEVSELQKYHKIRLVAGSERVPHQDIFIFLKKFINWGVGISSYEIGKDTTIFNLNDRNTFNTAICYESIYPDFFRRFVNKGADFSVVITNDGWWGKLSGTYQHNQFAILRAIENRRWIVRCANTGISCFIDPFGNMVLKTEINEREFINSKIGIKKDMTFYTKYGDLIGIISLYFSVILILTGVMLNFSGKAIRRKAKSELQ